MMAMGQNIAKYCSNSNESACLFHTTLNHIERGGLVLSLKNSGYISSRARSCLKVSEAPWFDLPRTISITVILCNKHIMKSYIYVSFVASFVNAHGYIKTITVDGVE